MQSYLFFDYKRSILMNIIGSNTIVLNEINSTNDYASKLLSHSKQIEGTIVLTDFQTNGKGQANNIWISDRGKNILLSIILKPGFLEIEKQFYLSMAISLAILHTIKSYSDCRVEVKWPNDIFLDSKKISGVLIKNTLTGNKIKYAIAGIGLNVNQTEFGDLNDKATSLKSAHKIEFERDKVLKTLMKYLNSYYEKLMLLKHNEIKTEYEKNLYKINTQSDFEISNPGSSTKKIFSGTITGVDNHGKLCIYVDGKTETFMHKEIAFV